MCIRDRSLYLYENTISIKLCNFPGDEYFKTNNMFKKNVSMIEVPIDQNQFSFFGTLLMKDTKEKEINKKMTLCIDNSKKFEFQIMKGFRDLLMSKICKDSLDCSKREDLNKFDPEDIIVEFNILGKPIEKNKEGFFICENIFLAIICLLYTSPSPRDLSTSRMPSSA